MKRCTKNSDSVNHKNGDFLHDNGSLIVKENLSPDIQLIKGRQESHLASKEITGLSSCDIEWQWTSPNGTAPRVKLRLGKKPLQYMETKCVGKSISPVNNFPRKRKLVRCEENEPIHTPFMMCTSTERLSSDYVQCRPENYAATDIESCSTDNVCAVESLSDESILKQKTDAEIYLSLLDDTDSFDDCLIKCSQYVEERLSQNPTNLEFTPVKATTPRRSPRVKLTVKPNRNSFQFKLSHAKVHNSEVGAAVTATVSKKSPQHAETNSCVSLNSSLRPNIRSGRDDLPTSTIHKFPNQISQDIRKLSTLSEEHTDVYPLPSSNLTMASQNLEIENDSFENILVTFCEENFELLSQSSKEEKDTNQASTLNLPSNNCQIQIDSRKIRTKIITPSASENVRSALEVSTSHGDTHNSTVLNTQPFCADNFDGDDLQPDLLKLLESVEANLQDPPLPTFCTPEEIEKKRREAKVKLQRKKNPQLADMKRRPTMT